LLNVRGKGRAADAPSRTPPNPIQKPAFKIANGGRFLCPFRDIKTPTCLKAMADYLSVNPPYGLTQLVVAIYENFQQIAKY